jgi:hypothetical protein
MHTFKRMLLAFVIIGAAASAGTARAQSMYGASDRATAGVGMIVDLVVLRPAGLLATILGGAAYVVSLPFSAAGGNANEAWNTLVAGPAQFTFARPLGDTSFSAGH